MSDLVEAPSHRQLWKPADRARVVALRISGASLDEIANRVGRSPAAVASSLSHGGVRIRLDKLVFTIRDAIREKAGAGWRYSRIARQHGVTESFVTAVVDRYGAIPPTVDEIPPSPAVLEPPLPTRPSSSLFDAMPRRARRVMRRISNATGVPVDAILAGGRRVDGVIARAAAAYWLRRLGYSYPRIGTFLGRDHSTCVTAARRHVERRAAQGRTLRPVTPPTQTEVPA